MARTTDITSFTEHRRQLRAHIDQVRRTGRPLYVTSRGEPEAVVLSPDLYDELFDLAELARSIEGIETSLSDVRAGRIRPFAEALSEIAAKYETPSEG